MVLLITSVHLFHSSKNVPGKQEAYRAKNSFQLLFAAPETPLKTYFVVLVAQVTNLPCTHNIPFVSYGLGPFVASHALAYFLSNISGFNH